MAACLPISSSTERKRTHDSLVHHRRTERGYLARIGARDMRDPVLYIAAAIVTNDNQSRTFNLLPKSRYNVSHSTISRLAI